MGETGTVNDALEEGDIGAPFVLETLLVSENPISMLPAVNVFLKAILTSYV